MKLEVPHEKIVIFLFVTKGTGS